MNPQSVDKPEATNISRAIGQIYHHTQGGELSGFKHNAMTQLASIIGFDCSCWFILNGDNDQPDIDNIFVFGLDEHLVADYCATFNHQCLAQLQRLDSRQQMVVVASQNNTHHVIILNRKAQNPAFSEHESAISHFICAHFRQAFHLYLQAQLKRHWIYRNSHRAICSQNGQIIEAEPGFIDALRQNIDGWDHANLPTANLSATVEYGNIKIQVEQDNGVLVAEAYVFDPHIELFTKAEKNIAKYLLMALSNKDIADKIDRSEKTIEHQVKSLCSKLGVDNRTQAIWELENSNYRF